MKQRKTVIRHFTSAYEIELISFTDFYYHELDAFVLDAVAVLSSYEIAVE